MTNPTLTGWQWFGLGAALGALGFALGLGIIWAMRGETPRLFALRFGMVSTVSAAAGAGAAILGIRLGANAGLGALIALVVGLGVGMISGARRAFTHD